jgi:hypothetical protein
MQVLPLRAMTSACPKETPFAPMVFGMVAVRDQNTLPLIILRALLAPLALSPLSESTT